MSSGEVTFQSPSQARLKYDTVPFSSYDQHERLLWEDLPLHSVRRLTVNMMFPPSDQELERFMELLRDPKSLEDFEFWGECGHALSRLGHYVAREGISLRIQTLTVRRGEDERHQALRLKRLFDAGGRDLDLRIPGCPGPVWKTVRTFRGEYFDAFEYDFCTVTIVKVLKALENEPNGKQFETDESN